MSQEQSHRQAFLEEAQDLLVELESSLLELESRPDDADIINRVFRAMHTIKGSGAMFGFDDVAAFTHEVETVFDRVRNGLIAVSKTLLDLTLAARDHISWLLTAPDPAEPEGQKKGREILAGLSRFAAPPAPPAPAPESPKAGPAEPETPRTFRIRFRPRPDIQATGQNPLHLLEDLSGLGLARIFVHTTGIPTLSDLDPQDCHVWWDIILNTTAGREAVGGLFLFVEDDSEIRLEQIDTGGVTDDGEAYKKLGEILVERGDLDLAELQAALASQRRLGDILTASGLVTPPQVEAALVEQAAVREMKKAREKPGEGVASIRVAADKLDLLVDLVGELVTAQSQIKEALLENANPVHMALSEQLERLSNDLRDSTLGIRMLPIGATFSKFRRLVRDLSAELGKEIEMRTSGEETELDKTVIERLGDPLVHLLRNAIDHGVESPEAREAAGKPRQGTIRLTAEHSGGEVLIKVVDDGKGLDPEVLFAKAVERGLVAPEAELSAKEKWHLIFLPGFSTAKAVTSVSGRGVGMDVVKRGIDALRGGVDIESEKGRGTTVTVRLPLTLAIIDGLMVDVGGECYVLPLSLVEECVEMAPADRDTSGRRFINLRGDMVPFVRLRECFAVQGRPPSIEQAVITAVDDMRLGIVVDTVVGEHQTVIKSLGRVYRDVEGFSGATIKGDGAMALILDVPALLRSIEETPAAKAARGGCA